MQVITSTNVRFVYPIPGPEDLVDKWSQKPIFRLLFTDNTQIVVKGEYRASRDVPTVARNIGLGAKLMHKVSPEVKGKVLTPAEINVLKGLQTWKQAGQHKCQIKPPVQKYLLSVLNSANIDLVFVKMPLLADLTDLKAKFGKNGGRGHKLYATLCNDPAALDRLGKIVAVDIFIGNKDRLCLDATSAHDKPIGSIANHGNVMFQAVGPKGPNRTYAPVGLDWYEVQGSFSDLTTAPPNNWPGMMLSTSPEGREQLRQFANNFIVDLNAEFSTALGHLPQQLVGADRFFQGLCAGREQLKAYLLTKANEENGLPDGVKERMRLLGWQAAVQQPAAAGWNYKPNRNGPKPGGGGGGNAGNAGKRWIVDPV